jgi:phosphatidate cytidylyltransferase
VLLPLLILILLKGSLLVFTCMTFVLSLLGLDEFYRMTLPHRPLERIFAALGGACLPVALMSGDFRQGMFLLAVLVLASALVLLFRLRDMPRMAADVALLWAGFLYVPFLLSHLVLARALPHGIAWVFMLLFVVMCGDSAAFYVGTALGKHRLYPEVSPKKSVEGAVGGLAGSVAGALVARGVFYPELAIVHAVAIALLLGLLGQAGDLFESMIKRSCGVKDSGTIIPGHGGMLDRLDSILFAAPALYYYAYLIVPRF